MAFEWAMNPAKLEQSKKWADDQVKMKKVPKATEAVIKERYQEIGGLVRDIDTSGDRKATPKSEAKAEGEDDE